MGQVYFLGRHYRKFYHLAAALLIFLYPGSERLHAQISLPYTENFSGIAAANGFPTVAGGAWSKTGTNALQPTYIANQTTYNRIGHGDTKFMSFRYGQTAGGNIYAVGPFNLTANTTYQAGIWYIADGGSGFGPFSLTYGSAATVAAQTNTIVSLPASVNNTSYAQMSGAFTPATTGSYYIAIKCEANTTPWYLSIDDFTVNTLPACSAAPNPGNTISSSNPACANTPVTLSIQNPQNVSGITYQWETSPNGTAWTPVLGANAATYTLSQTVATYYRVIVTCTNTNQSTTSTAVYVTQNLPASCYCIPVSTVTGYYINNFTTTGGTTNISNLGSGDAITSPGYSNYLAQSTGALPNGTVNFTGSFGSSTSYTFGVKIYVDWNQNGDFTDAGDNVFSTPGYTNSISGSFTVPPGATIGATRMRVRADYLNGTGPASCGSIADGEAEDYTFNVVAPVACSGTPPTATATTFSPLAVTGFNADVIANGVGAANTTTTADVDGGGYYFLDNSYQYTSASAAPTYALPANGIINSAATTSLTYKLQSAAGNNSLRIATTNGSGTLTLTTPVAATNLYLLATSGSGAATVTVTVNFTNATSQSFTGVAIADWFGGSPVAIGGIGRVTATNTQDGTATDPRLYQVSLPISAANASLNIASVTVTRTSTAGYVQVMAVSASTPTPAAVCGGTTKVLSMPSASNSTGFTYQWQESSVSNGPYINVTGGTGANTLSYTTPTLSATKYYVLKVTCTTSNLSALSNEIALIVSAVPTLSVSSLPANATICGTGSVNLTASGNGIAYTWSPGTGLSATNIANPIATPTATTVYTVTATNATGCTNTASKTVFVYSQTTISAQASPATLCNGGVTTLSAVDTNFGSITLPAGYTNGTVTYPTVDEDLGTLTLGAFSNTTTCGSLVGTIGTATGTAGSYSNFTAVTPKRFIAGSTYPLSVSSITCGTSNYSNAMAVYIDYNQNGLFNDAGETVYASTATVSGAHTETASVTIPASAKTGATRMRVIVNETSLVSGPQMSPAYGEIEDYSIQIIRPGTVLAATGYTWSPTGSVTSATGSPTTSTALTAPTTFTVTGTDTNGCTATASVAVAVSPQPTITSAPSTPVFCTGGSVVLTASAGTAYKWLLNGTLIPGVATATYTVTAGGNYRTVITNGACDDTSAAVAVVLVPTTIYVDSSITASGDGGSWPGAKKTVGEALALANSANCSTSIWVKKGTYFPTTGTGSATTNRDSSLRILRNGIKVYGGFGGTETLLTQRNSTTNPTILSGDIGTANDSTDNSYHVVTIVATPAAPIDTTTLIDGFTITSGKAEGGTSFSVNGQAFFRWDGAGVYIWGGGAGNNASPLIQNNIFTRNTAVYGGAMYVASSNGVSNPVIADCSFQANRSAGEGGAICIVNNGGASSVSIRNSSFTGNATGANGGAVYSGNGAVTLNNSSFTGNTASGFGGAIQLLGTASLTAGNSTFTGQVSLSDGGAIYASVSGKMLITNSRFINNNAGSYGGGIVSLGGPMSIRSSVFSGNSCTTGGGAVHSNSGGSDTVMNSLFTGNSAALGGGIQHSGGAQLLSVINSTFYNNTAATAGGGLRFEGNAAAGQVFNCILWGNAAPAGAGISNAGTAAFTVSNSTVQGGYAGTANLATDPQFVNASDPDGADNTWATGDDGLKLTPCSPAINAGNNSLLIAGATTDITGAARVQQTTVDGGAYEHPYNSTGLPDIAITQTSPAINCSVAPFTFSATTLVAPGTVTNITWFRNSTIVQNGTGTTYSSALVTGDTVWAVLFNADCGIRDTSNRIVITVATFAGQPSSITGATVVCSGISQTYTVANAANVSSYTWTLPSGWSGSSTTNSIAAMPGATGGTISVTANNVCGASVARTLAVTSSATPAQPSPINGNTSLCQNVTATYSVTADPTVTTYNWILPAGWGGSSTTNSITITSTATGGTISVTGTNYCGTSIARTIAVTSSATPILPGTISGASAVCSGIAQTYSIPALAGVTSYNWTLPPGWTGSSTTNGITATPNGTGGTVSVTVTSGCGTSTASTKSVSSTTAPAQPATISGATAVCSGISQTYSVVADPNVTTYSWMLPTGWTGTSTTNSITVIPAATGGTITVSGTNYCGAGAVRTLAVSSTTTPVQPGGIIGATAICNGLTQPYAVTAVPSATSYAWTLPTGWSGSSTNNTISVVAGAGSGNVTVTASNYCGTSAQQSLAVTVTSTPVQPGTISGAAAPCEGTQQPYSIAAVPAATSYTWTYPSGWTGGSTTTGINLLTSASSGAVSVSASNFCGTSATQTLAINTIPLPAQPGTISGPVQVCSGTPQTYSVSQVPNTSAYQWTLPGGWVGTSTTNTITVTTGTTSGAVTVSAFGVCGYGPQRALAVTTTQTVIPTIAAAATGGNVICAGTPVTFTQTSTNAGTAPVYTWRRNGTVVWIGPSYTGYNLQNGDSVTVSVTSSTTCALPQTVTGAAVYITVNPVVVPGISISTTPPATLCAGTAITLHTNKTGGGTNPQYQWYKNGVLIGGATNDSLAVTAAVGTDTFTVTLNSNAACATPAQVVSNKRWIIGVSAVTPTITISASPGIYVPAGSTVVFTAAWTNPGQTPAITWYRNGSPVTFANTNTYTATNVQNGDTISVALINYDGCAIPGTVRAGIRIGTPTGIGSHPTSGTWDNSGSIVIHPNPSSGRFEIDAEWGADHIGERVVIELYNALGQTVYSTEVKPDKRKWTVSVWLGDAVANGIYQLSIRTPTMRAARPVLLSR